MTLVFFVPAIVVSLGLIAWQLVARRGEALDAARTTVRPHQSPATSERYA